MSVLARMSASEMTSETHDQATAQLTPPLLAAPGFVSHVTFEADGKFHVSEPRV